MNFVPLSEAADVQMGTAPPGASYNQSGKGIPMIAGAGDYGEEYPEPKKWTTEPARVAKKGDLIVCVRATIGDLNWADKDYCLGRGVAGVRAKTDVADIKYLAHFICSRRRQLIKLGTGSTFLAIRRDDLKNFAVPLPPLEEQKRIAAILDKADAIRRKRQQAIELTDQFLRSVFLDMFGDPVTNSKGWEKHKLIDLAIDHKRAIVDGPFGASLKTDQYVEEGVPVIRINNIRKDGFLSSNFKYITAEKFNELDRSKVNKHDILVARVGHTIGKSCIFNQDFDALLSTTGVCKVTCDPEKIHYQFLSILWNLSSFQSYILQSVRGAAQPYFNLTTIKDFLVIKPPIDLQLEFIEKVEMAGFIKSKFKKTDEFADSLLESLVQRAFNGELSQNKAA